MSLDHFVDLHDPLVAVVGFSFGAIQMNIS
jgi:hypothetical protein